VNNLCGDIALKHSNLIIDALGKVVQFEFKEPEPSPKVKIRRKRTSKIILPYPPTVANRRIKKKRKIEPESVKLTGELRDKLRNIDIRFRK